MTPREDHRLSAWFGQDVTDLLDELDPKEREPWTSWRAWPYPLNTPGPMYVSNDNLVSLAGMQADEGRMVSTDGTCEHFWRQPCDVAELRQALQAADQDEMASYRHDGCWLWTPLAVVHWWAGRGRLCATLHEVLRTTRDSAMPWKDGDVSHDVVRRHLAYFEGGMEADLRRFVYFLTHRSPPASGVSLPIL